MIIASDDSFDFSQGSPSIMDALFQALTEGNDIKGQTEPDPAPQENPILTEFMNQMQKYIDQAQNQIDQIMQTQMEQMNSITQYTSGDFFG